ncbi:hypothetical protein ZTR_11136 [Talaromyces verruculosus]|nr:hypothetical protein ZTR_11136 [Talaromyces verruculosus]
MIVGIGFPKPELGEWHVSRSTLGLTIGASAAQHEISRAMGGDGDEEILSTLIDKMDIADIPHLAQWQNQRNPRLLTYPGPMMTFNAPVPPTSWQGMQAPYNFPPWASQSGSWNGFPGYQQGFQQPGFQQHQPGFQGFQQFQQPRQSFQKFRAPEPPDQSQTAELLKDWSDLSASLMESEANLADFSNILKAKVPAIIQYLDQTQDRVRQLNKKRFQQFQDYSNKDKLKVVIQGWSQNIQSAPSSHQFGLALRELLNYAELLGHLQD